MGRFQNALKDEKILLVDTTLRDGEQTAGVVFSNQEKLQIARMLDGIGVHQIEAGVPVMGGDEKNVVRKIVDLELEASIMGWNRAHTGDVQHSIDCGVDSVAISISTSDIHIVHKLRTDRDWVLSNMTKAVRFAKKAGLYVSVNAEDASRSELDFLLKFAREARDAGADRLRYCDTVGVLEPFKTYELVKTIIEETGMEIEMHTHNDFGMATANALAGARAGARLIGVTVSGLGERAGNAALEEITMALKFLMGTDMGIDTKRFHEVSEYVGRAAGRPVSPGRPIVGSNAFAHESGIHADGVLKNPATYEVFSPEDVGLQRQIIIGKHSGSKSVMMKFKEYGIQLTGEEAGELLPMVRSATVELKRPLFDKEIMYIYEDYLHQKRKNKHVN